MLHEVLQGRTPLLLSSLLIKITLLSCDGFSGCRRKGGSDAFPV